MRWLRGWCHWGRCPQTPGIYRAPARIAVLLRNLGAAPPNPRDTAGGRRWARLPAIPAAESALGLRPRRALSPAQVLPGWTTSTSPCNNRSANGDYPLNFVSHSKGSLHSRPHFPCCPRSPELRFPCTILTTIPAILQIEEGFVRWRAQKEYYLFVRYWFTRRVKASHATRTRQDRFALGPHSSLVLFVALPETENKTDPGCLRSRWHCSPGSARFATGGQSSITDSASN